MDHSPAAPKTPPMDANANPGFEVATIKPTKPDEQRIHSGLVDAASRPSISRWAAPRLLVWGAEKQLIGLPPWADTEKYDIDAEPESEVRPTADNCREWCRS